MGKVKIEVRVEENEWMRGYWWMRGDGWWLFEGEEVTGGF
jgi:hypothetical protein